MTNLEAPDCKLFVDADVSDAELVGMVGEILFAAPDSADLPPCEADIRKNDDYDSNRRRQFPGGFVYFPYIIDLYIDESPVEARAALTARLLESLWSWGFPAVAACDYEALLPHGGGYRSRAIPWPGA